jgi:hypothetical protein
MRVPSYGPRRTSASGMPGGWYAPWYWAVLGGLEDRGRFAPQQRGHQDSVVTVGAMLTTIVT